jgi:hypothetical protein
MDGMASDAASADAGTDQSRAVVSDPAPAAVPAWVGTAVWRGIWQLIAAVLLTAAGLWFAGQAQAHFHTTVVSTSSAASSGQATQQVTQYLQDHAGDLLGAVGSLVGAVFSLFTVGLFTFYFTTNGPQIRRVLLSRMPPERQRRALWAWNTAIDKTGEVTSTPGWKPAGTLAHAGDPRSAPADDRHAGGDGHSGSSGAVVATLVMTQRPAPAARRLAIPTGDGMATLVAPAMAWSTPTAITPAMVTAAMATSTRLVRANPRQDMGSISPTAVATMTAPRAAFGRYCMGSVS